MQFNIGAGLTISSINGGDLSYTPATNNQVYQAMGYANRDALVADMIGKPEQPWAYRILGTAGQQFNNFQFQFQ